MLDFSIVTIHLGPIPIHVWGLFVALGFVAATFLAVRWSNGTLVKQNDILDFAVWAIVSAFVGARVGHIIFYDFALYVQHPLDVFKVWEGGLSSFGGFVGALIAGAIFTWHRKIPFIAFSDVFLRALPFGMAIGRIGCYLTREHPGVPCSGVLCVAFPDGVRRLDLGLTEAIFALVIGFSTYALRRLLVRPGATTAFVLIAYGVGRFILDNFRVADARYLTLTPAQWGSAAFVALGLFMVYRIFRSRR